MLQFCPLGATVDGLTVSRTTEAREFAPHDGFGQEGSLPAGERDEAP